MSTTSPEDPETTRRIQKNRSLAQFFYVGMALYMVGIVLVGFWPSYFSIPIAGGPLSEEIAPRLTEGALVQPSWLIHLHVAIFGGWILLFLAQTALVAGDQTESHISFGHWGVLYGVFALAAGLSLVLQGYWGHVQLGRTTWAEFPTAVWSLPLPGWYDMIQFAILLALGYRYRANPAIHKRFMVFATFVFLHPAFGRLDYLLGSWNHQLMILFLAGPVFLYDLYSRQRIHPASLIGTAILGVDIFVIFPLIFG